MSDLWLTVETVRVMTGRQVTDLEDYFHRLGGITPIEQVPPGALKRLQAELLECGYAPRWVILACGGKPVHKWVRDTWPNDSLRLSSYVVGSLLPGSGPVEAYVPFD